MQTNHQTNHALLKVKRFEKPVHLLKRIPYRTPPQDLVKSLCDNHVTLTNLHISSYGGATVIKFGQKVQGFNVSP